MQCAASARITDADDPAAQATPRRTCTGTGEQILDDLAQLARSPAIRWQSAWLECPSGTLSEQLDQIERFGAEVIPEAKKLKPAGPVEARYLTCENTAQGVKAAGAGTPKHG